MRKTALVYRWELMFLQTAKNGNLNRVRVAAQFGDGRGLTDRVLRQEAIAHVVSSAYHPETLGKDDRLRGTVDREFWQPCQPEDLVDARCRLALFIAHPRSHRPYQGLSRLVPANRFVGAAETSKAASQSQMDACCLAPTLCATTRSLHKWAQQSRTQVPPRCLRRPGHSEVQVVSTRKTIDHLQKKTSRPPSWRMARQALGAEHPTRLIQRVVRAKKCASRRAHRNAHQDQRIHHEFLRRNAVWATEATHIDRTEDGAPIYAKVLCDVTSGSLLSAVACPPAPASSDETSIEATIAKHGVPLVIQSDNGREKRGPEVAAVLDRHQVILMPNLAHTPEHNPVGERANGLLNQCLDIRKHNPPRHLPILIWQVKLDGTRHWMNTAFPRHSRGGKTLSDSHATLPAWYRDLSRGDSFATARSAVERAAKFHESPRKQRRAKRAAHIARWNLSAPSDAPEDMPESPSPEAKEFRRHDSTIYDGSPLG